jgi:uncharacterized protein (DUF58 family)
MDPGTQHGEDGEEGAKLLDPAFLRLLQQVSFQLKGQVRGERRGERRSPQRGHGGSFLDVRPYAPGDDLRHLDWHLYARLDALLVRLYEEPQEHPFYVLLDASASMGCGKGRYALQLAAALAYLALVGNDQAGVFLLKSRVEAQLGPLRGRDAAHKVMRFLLAARFGGGTDLASAVGEFARVRRRGTAFLVSDFLVPEGRVEAIHALAKAGCRAVVVHLLSPQERMPSLDEDLTLVDSETGAELMVSLDKRTRDAYVARVRALAQELREACARYGFGFVEATSDQALEDLLLGELRKQGWVG